MPLGSSVSNPEQDKAACRWSEGLRCSPILHAGRVQDHHNLQAASESPNRGPDGCLQEGTESLPMLPHP